MRVRVLAPYQVVTGDGVHHYPGDLVDVDDATADLWAARGWVVGEPAEPSRGKATKR